jgi:predicted Zn-dependent protease
MALAFASTAGAADGVSAAIEKAQGLALKKNRREAAQILRNEITNLPANSKNRPKLIEALAQITTIFLTDKGQRTFETGQSIMFDNPDLAMGRFNEALAMEDGNISVLQNIARLQMTKLDCEGARSTIDNARAINPYFAELALLEARDLLCLKDYEVFREKMKALPAPLTGWDASFSQYLLAQDFLEQNMYKKALELLTKVSEEQGKFPEVYYYLWKAGAGLNRDTEAWKLRYASLCKSIGPKEKKQFAQEPRLCVNLKEVEDELAKDSGEG